jgi:hypothetical protein
MKIANLSYDESDFFAGLSKFIEQKLTYRVPVKSTVISVIPFASERLIISPLQRTSDLDIFIRTTLKVLCKGKFF